MCGYLKLCTSSLVYLSSLRAALSTIDQKLEFGLRLNADDAMFGLTCKVNYRKASLQSLKPFFSVPTSRADDRLRVFL